ncbi:hypothetical protein ABPG77_000009 [Micractinium sp. CCAP 211/92]
MSRPKRGGGAPSGPPPLLQRLYGEGNVVCLRELLLRLCALSHEAAALPAALVQPHDHADYAQVLLERTWCVLRADAPPLRDGFSLSQAAGQHQLVGRAVEALLGSGQHKSGSAGGNVLCYGFRKRRPHAGGRNVPGMATAEASHHNSTTASLCSPAWQLLLSRIGDTLMLYLLLHVSMFAELPNACCLQLSGTPIGQVARAWRKQAPAAVAAAATRVMARDTAASNAAAQADPATQPASANGAGESFPTGGPATQMEQAAADEEEAHKRAAAVQQQAQQREEPQWQLQLCQAEQQGSQQPAQPAVRKPQLEQGQQRQQQLQQARKARPSSWQRRRAAKLRQQEEAQQAQQLAAGAGPAAMQGALQPGEAELPSTEEIEVGPSSGDGLVAAALVPAPHPVAAEAPGRDPAARQPPLAALSPAAPAAPGRAGDAGGPAEAAAGVCRRDGSVRWPARMPRPADMVLQRSPIFYCASFSQKPGLTSQHILSKLRGSLGGERLLYAAIFDPLHSPVGRDGAAYANVQSVVPPMPRRIPAQHRHLLPLLRQVIARSARCPFSILLQHHCPLPPQLQQEQQQRRLRQRCQAVGEAGAAAGAGGTAGGRVTGALALPSQGALLRQAMRGPAAGTCGAGTAGTAGKAPVCVESLMDELFRGEAAPAKATGTQATAAAAAAEATVSPCIDELMDELFELEQENTAQPQHAERASKRPRTHTAAAPAAEAAVTAAAGEANRAGHHAGSPSAPVQGHAHALTAAADGAAGGHSSRSLPSTQPAPQLRGAPQQPRTGGPPLAACFVPYCRVTAFVWAAVRAIVPAALLGDVRNRRGLRGAISRFVRLRRYEQMSLHQAMQGLRLSGFPWLQPGPGRTQPAADAAGQAPAQQQQQQQQEGGEPSPRPPRPPRPPRLCASQHAAHQRLLALWLGWLFAALVVPLLRSHFYCTESEAYRQQVFYYRKPVWAALARGATNELAQQQFAALSDGEALGILQGRRLGVARLRLLPKRTGMRAILNLGGASTVRFRRAAQYAGPGTTRRCLPPVKLTFRPVNSLLQNVYQVLRYEASCQPHLLGSSVFGYNDAFCKLQPFLRKWRAAASAAATTGDTLRPLIASVDITRAFDHVSVPLLLSLVEPLLQREQYAVLKYSEVVPSLGQVKVLHRRLAVAAGSGWDAREAPTFPQLAQRWAAAHKGKAFTDQVTYDRLSRQQALDLLRQHLTANIVRLRRRWCAQRRGIAQGSTLSTLLCSLYLAHMERTQLAGVLDGPLPPPSGPAHGAAGAAGTAGTAGQESVVVLTGGNAAALSPATGLQQAQETGHAQGAQHARQAQQLGCSRLALHAGSLLLRLVDDFLLITAVPAVAQGFASRMLDGFPSHNVHVNPDKTKLSFALQLPAAGPPNPAACGPAGAAAAAAPLAAGSARSESGAAPAAASRGTEVVPATVWRSADGATFVKWCGLLINVATLELQGDYTRYAGEHVSTALTLPLRRQPGLQLAARLCHYLRPKIHPLLLDATINSPQTVRLNIYQAFLLGAMKLHCYVKALPAAPAPGTRLLLDAILTGIGFMRTLTRRRRVASAHQQDLQAACCTRIPAAHIRWMGLTAFIRVLRSKQTRYGQLLAELEELAAAPALRHAARQLAPVVDPSRSSAFECILY